MVFGEFFLLKIVITVYPGPPDAGTSFNKIRISLPNTEMQHPSKYPRPKIVRTLIAGHKDHSERHEDGGEGDEERVQAHQHRPD